MVSMAFQPRDARSRLPGASTIVLILIAAACGQPAQQAETRIVETDEVAAIGMFDDSIYALSDITNIVVDREQNVYVGSTLDGSIRKFDRNGVLVSSIGGRGRGPAEFERLMQIGILYDTVWASDLALRRTVFLSQDGTELASEDYSQLALPSQDRALMPLPPRGFLAGGAVVVPGILPRLDTSAGRRSLPIYLVDRQTLRPVELGAVTVEVPRLAVSEGSRNTYFAQPFDDRTLSALGSHGMLFVERRAFNDEGPARFSLYMLRAPHDTLWQAHSDYDPVPIERKSADEAIGRIVAAAGARGHEIRDRIYVPRYHAPVTRALVTNGGNVWLRREERADSVAWDLFEPGTGITKRLYLPERTMIEGAVDSLIWTVESEPFPKVRVLRVGA
jgi:hypothetical protein